MGRRILVQTFTGRRNWPRAKERLSRLIGKVVVFYVKMADGFRKQFSASGLIHNQCGVSCGMIACSDVTEGNERQKTASRMAKNEIYKIERVGFKTTFASLVLSFNRKCTEYTWRSFLILREFRSVCKTCLNSHRTIDRDRTNLLRPSSLDYPPIF
ncbi:hypothetical protein YC2023_040906 [Brassica napus]